MVDEASYIPASFSLSQTLREQLSSRTGCQRCIVGETNEILLIVHEVPEVANADRRAILFWRSPSLGWQNSIEQNGLQELSQLLERYAITIDRNEALVDDADTAKEIFELVRHAAPLARSTRNLFTTLVDAAHKLPKDKEIRNLRDRAQELERAADLLYSDSKVALEFYRAERAEEQSESSERLTKIGYRLNLIAGLSMPLVAFGGLMGMNVEIPKVFYHAFWSIVSIGMILGLIILFLVGRNVGKNS